MVKETLRDKIATQAMVAIISSDYKNSIMRGIKWDTDKTPSLAKEVSKIAYWYADEMLKERESKND